MDSSHIFGGAAAEECQSSESGWTMYIGSPIHGDDDDDDDDQSNNGDANHDDHDNEDESDDSMVSDASSGPSHQAGNQCGNVSVGESKGHPGSMEEEYYESGNYGKHCLDKKAKKPKEKQRGESERQEEEEEETVLVKSKAKSLPVDRSVRRS